MPIVADAAVAIRGDLSKYNRDLQKAVPPTQKLGKTLDTALNPKSLLLGVGGGFAVSKLADFLGDSIEAASSLNEEITKSGVVFGDAAPKVQAFAEGAADIGLSTRAALGAAGAFGNMFNTVGLAQDASADMSVTMVQLAADMASFNNQDPSEMLLKLRSGLAGEAEPLRQDGEHQTEAAVKAVHYKNGIAEQGAVLSEAQKVQARYGLILEQTAIQQGDVERSGGTLAAQQRELAAEWENMQAEIGAGLIPVMLELGKVVKDDVLPFLTELFGIFGEIGEASDELQGALGSLGDQARETGIELDPKEWATAIHDAISNTVPDLEFLRAKTEETSNAWAEAWAAMPESAKAAYGQLPAIAAAAAPGIEAATEQTMQSAIVNPLRRAANRARELARRQFGRLPEDISDAIENNLPDIEDGLDALKDLMRESLSDIEKERRLEGILASKALARGLKDERFDVRAAALLLEEETEAELRKLRSGAADAAADGGDAYAQWLLKKKDKITDAAGDLADAANSALEFDASTAGLSVGQSYIYGLTGSIVSGVQSVQDALYYLKVNSIGGSLPKSGPMAEPEAGAVSSADAYIEALAARLRGGLAAVQASLVTALEFQPSGSLALGGGSLSPAAAGVGGVVIHNHLPGRTRLVTGSEIAADMRLLGEAGILVPAPKVPPSD